MLSNSKHQPRRSRAPPVLDWAGAQCTHEWAPLAANRRVPDLNSELRTVVQPKESL